MLRLESLSRAAYTLSGESVHEQQETAADGAGRGPASKLDMDFQIALFEASLKDKS
ncbi:hypothetical protein StoSoilA2_21550 [Arthrobacter sp. StoSoilA2]|uniref:hypothetical protein n=1 Tax=Arthrobacter sp. StoSoilA2 TaxID=2830990 RepID=UPI001CC77C8D|nr:hypothetical protein [Arthrobacter sp. StoSoilA2]BCW36099.1 hypothetical protein StoSoilA2_21550 [Arthrobacter sp. StoSoilA2]